MFTPISGRGGGRLGWGGPGCCGASRRGSVMKPAAPGVPGRGERGRWETCGGCQVLGGRASCALPGTAKGPPSSRGHPRGLGASWRSKAAPLPGSCLGLRPRFSTSVTENLQAGPLGPGRVVRTELANRPRGGAGSPSLLPRGTSGGRVPGGPSAGRAPHNLPAGRSAPCRAFLPPQDASGYGLRELRPPPGAPLPLRSPTAPLSLEDTSLHGGGKDAGLPG